jgi:hypothetical protein
MNYKIEWVYPVLPNTTPATAKDVVKVNDYVWIKDLSGGLAEVAFADVSGGAAEKITGNVTGNSGIYYGSFTYAGNRTYTFNASVAKGFISGMIFRHGPAEDSGGHWGGR